MKKLLTLLLLTIAFSVESKQMDYARFTSTYRDSKEFKEIQDQFYKMEGIRNTAQKSLLKLMKKRSTVELELRYGELILQRARDVDEFSLELDAAGKSKESKQYKSKARDLFHKGLGLHNKILKRIGKHKMKGRVYLGIARTERSLGRLQKSVTAARQGLRSKNDRESQQKLYMVLGDASFGLSQAQQALLAYREAIALSSKGSLDESYLNYKIAWSLYNLKDPATAISQLRKLIDVNRDRYALKREAIRDFGLMAADLSRSDYKKIGGVQEIHSYLTRVTDLDLAENSIERMANSFADTGKRKEAIEALLYLITENPNSKENVDRALKIVGWEHRLADKWDLVERYHWLLDSFGPESRWAKKMETHLDVLTLAHNRIEKSIREYAISLHKDALESGSEKQRKEYIRVVARLYDEHIKAFEEVAHIRYYRAEIYRMNEEWLEAARSYDRYLVLLRPIEANGLSKTDKKLKKEVALASVEMWAKVIKSEPKFAVSFIEASDKFLEHYPKDALAAQILFDSAKVDFERKQSAGALHRIDRLVETYPRTEQTEKAVHAALDILNKEGDWVNLAQRARYWVDNIIKWSPKKEIAKNKKDLTLILSKTELKACDELSKNRKRLIESALCFESFARGFSKDKQAPMALLKSADIYEKLDKADAALDSLEMLVKDYPRSEQAEAGFARLASVYEKSFQFKKASFVYESLLKRKKIENREEVVARLLAILQGTSQVARLSEWLKKNTVPEPLKKEIRSREIQILFNKLRHEEVLFGYSGGDFSSAKARAFYKLLQVFEKTKQLSFAQSLNMHRYRGNLLREKNKLGPADKVWMAGLKKFWRHKGKTPEIWEAAARLRLDQSTFWLIQFQRISVRENPTKKISLYSKLENWYSEVIKMKAPAVALEALWRSGQLYSEFSKELIEIPETSAQGQEMARKSSLVFKEMARRAKSWDILSPAMLAALADMNSSAKGVDQLNKKMEVRFPWKTLPVWIDLDKETLAWDEWSLSTKELSKKLKDTKSRKEARRLSFVYVTRVQSLSDEQSADWLATIPERRAVQLRIQAMLNDAKISNAELFLTQYETLYGRDAFSAHHIGKLSWLRGDYRSAYDHWVKRNSFEKDFRSLYWKNGWNQIFDVLAGESVADAGTETFEKLKSYGKQSWENQYLLNLCLTEKITCEGNFADTRASEIISKRVLLPYLRQSSASVGAWDVKKENVVTYLEKNLKNAKTYDDVKKLRVALTELYHLKDYALSPSNVLKQYTSFKKQIDQQQEKVDKGSNKILAGATQ